MAFKVIGTTKDNQQVEIVSTKFLFVCDRCGNTANFVHGMETFSPNDRNDKRIFCSQICAQIAVGGVEVAV